MLPKLKYLHNMSVKSALGSNLLPEGLVNCVFHLGKRNFTYKFIVVKLCRTLILGSDFHRGYKTGNNLSDAAETILSMNKQVHDESLDISIHGPRRCTNGMYIRWLEHWQC